jgi:ATP-binding cassette subfamily B protein
METTFIGRFDARNGEAVDAFYRAERHSSAMGPSVNFVNNLSLALISVFGAIMYALGAITLGGLSAFVLYSRKFSGPINEMANIINEIQSACAAAERVFAMLDEKPEPPDAAGALDAGAAGAGDAGGLVEFDGVEFGYEPGRKVIRSLSFSAPPGSLVAIVGQTGAGKTTIINLLMRFCDPDSGRISLDGRDISLLTRKSLRKSFALVLQDVWLFHGTVADNIAYGSKGATRAQIVAAAKAAKLHSFVSRLPMGYDTVLSEDGLNISQGQKQLVAIARAMLADARMLILDEATSNVDTRTEFLIQEAMRKLMRGKTCFVIAHRLSTIRNADRILVMSGGEIVEAGTHDELIRADGAYAAMYASQFK